MALEDLTGTKYLSDLVETNPSGQDLRTQVGAHLRGIKNVSKLSFPNLTGAVNCTPAELNLMVGKTSIPGTFASGTECYFYQSAAPTGWSKETALASLDGATLRVETGAGGGAVAGTHNINSPPNWTHDHTDTLVVNSFTLTSSYMPAHTHTWANQSTNEDATPELSASYSVKDYNKDSNNVNDHYELDSTTGTATLGRTSSTGSAVGHTHTLSGVVSSATPSSFSPKYITVILCSKD